MLFCPGRGGISQDHEMSQPVSPPEHRALGGQSWQAMGGHFKWFLTINDAELGQLIPLALTTEDGSAASPV